MNILGLATDAAALITDIRLAAPLSALAAAQAHGWRLLDFHRCRQADLAWADVVVAQRPCSARDVALLRRARRAGLALVCDFDDLLTEMAPHLLHQRAMRARVRDVQRALALADVVSVSTQRLGQALAADAPQWRWVPNHAQPCSLPLPSMPDDGSGGAAACVLVAASDRMLMGGLLQALQRLQGRRGSGLRIVSVGPASSAFDGAGLCVDVRPLLPRAAFIALARSLPGVVAAIPLDDSRFSACKSAVKWFDYAEAGIPTVAARRGPYADAIEHGRTGWLVGDGAAEWESALTLALDNAQARRDVMAAARLTVRERHGPAQTAAAWQTTLADALRLSRQRNVAPTPEHGARAGWARLCQRCFSACSSAWFSVQAKAQDFASTLRGLNRRRLARRSARKERVG